MIGDEAAIQMILAKHLSGQVPEAKIKQITKDIAKLEGEWEEIHKVNEVVGANVSVQCSDICAVGDLYQQGVPIRIFRKKADSNKS